MIVKNEEKNLDRTLNALMKLKGKLELEIVIVDTGSTDNTISIAKKYTDRVYCHKWNDDFAAMRNISIKYCTGEWILILDADEVIANPEELINFFRLDYKRYNSAIVKIVNYTDKKNEMYVISGVFRLFKNLPEFCYKGKVHEQPVLIKPLGNTKVSLDHYGYIHTDYELMKYKYQRNIDLLLKEVKVSKDPIYINFQLAQSYDMANQRKEALCAIKKAYELVQKGNLYKSRTNILHLYAQILFEMLDFEKTIEIAEKFMDYTEAKLDFYYMLGISSKALNRINKAEEYFEKYLMLHEKQTENGYIQDAYISEFSFCLKNEVLAEYVSCLYKDKIYEKAYEYYFKINDNNKRLLLEQIYINLLLKLGKYKELKEHLKKEAINDTKVQFISDIIERIEIESDVDNTDVINNFLDINDKVDLLINVLYKNKINIDLDKLDINKFYKWKWRLIDKTEEKNIDFINKIKVLNNGQLINYLSNMVQDYDWIKIIDDFCNKNFLSNDIVDLNFIITAEQLLLFSNKISQDNYKRLVKRTFINITNYVSKIYNLKYFNRSNYNSLVSNYFSMWLKYGELIKVYSEDRVRFIKGLKDLVNEMPEFKTLLEFCTKEINVDPISKDMIKEKEKLLSISEGYISEGKYEKALEILNELNSIFMYDSNIINMLGITQFYLKDNNNALINLAFSYEISPDNFDIVYNLAFVLDSVDKKEEAKEYYKKALDLSTDEEIRREICEKI